MAGGDDGWGGGPVGPLLPGDPAQVDGHRLLGRLGEGGQGRVYLAAGPDGEQVALKVLLPEIAADPVARQRVADQLGLTRHLPSFAVVRLIAARVEGEPPYLVSEYVPGPSLADHVRRSGPLHGEALERLVVGTLQAVEAIHRAGVVHHDLKPANVLLGPSGPKIADFDIALRPGARDPLASEEGVIGSAAFLAPERLDAGPAIRASDMFAWAATMVYAATGRSPFHAADVAGVVDAIEHRPPQIAGVPEHLRPLLVACLEKDPRRRPTVLQASDRLDEALRPPGAPSARPASQSSPTGTPAWGTAPAPGQSAAPAGAGTAPAWGTPAAAGSAAAAPAPTTSVSYPMPGRVRKRLGPWGWAGLVGGLAGALVLGMLELPDGVDVGPSGRAPNRAVTYGGDAATHDEAVVRLVEADGSVRRFSLADPASKESSEVVYLQRHDRMLLTARFSADGRRVVTAEVPHEAEAPAPVHVTVWDTVTGAAVSVPSGALAVPGGGTDVPGGVRPEVGLSADGAFVAASVQGHGVVGPGRVVARRVLDPQPLLDVTVPDLSEGGLVLSRDGRWLAYRHGASASNPAGVTRVVDLQAPGGTGADLTVPCDGPVAFAVGQDRDGPVVLCRRQGGEVLFLTPDGATAAPPIRLACRSAVPLSVAPDGGAVACADVEDVAGGSRRSVLRIASLRGAARQDQHELPEGPPNALAWDTGGGRVVVGFPDRPFAAVRWNPRAPVSTP